MKNHLNYFFLFSIMLFLGCTSEGEAFAEPAAPAGRTLVAYYSYTGDSRAIATELGNQMAVDILEVKPAVEGLDYAANGYRIGADQINAINAAPDKAESYPAIKPTDVDISSYANIIVVAPLWHSHMAAPMQSFLFHNSSRMAGKTVALVVSSHSSGISSVVADARRLLPSVVWAGDALWINNSNRSRKAELIADWLNNMTFSEQTTTSNMKITAGGKTFTATLADNATAAAFAKMLPLSLSMSELNGNEKYCYMDTSLPTSAINPGTIHAGDIMLYGNSCVVVFYETFTTSYSYTPIGRIDNADGLKAALGSGSVVVEFGIGDASGIAEVTAEGKTTDEWFSIDGRRVSEPQKGIFIKDGKKIAKH